MLIAFGAGTGLEIRNSEGKTAIDIANDMKVSGIVKNPKRLQDWLHGPRSQLCQ